MHLVAAKSIATGKPVLYRCDYGGMSCTVTDISAGQSTQSDVQAALIDPAASKLLVVAADGSFTPALYRCNLDGTGCVYTSLAAVPATPEIYEPTAVLDPGRAALYAVGSGVVGGALYEFTSSL